jgi:O-antigen/teichoic acid export membrane protein
MSSVGTAIPAAAARATRGRSSRGAFVRSGAVVLAATLMWHASNFAFNSVAARLLGPGGYSELAATVALLYLVSPLLVSIQTLSSHASTELSVAEAADQIRNLLWFYGRRLALVGALATGAVAVSSSAIAGFLHIHSGLPITIVGAGLCLSLLTHCQRGVLQGTQRFGRYATSTLVEASVKVIVAAALLSWIWPSVEGAVLAVPLAAACSLAANTVLLRFLPRRAAARPRPPRAIRRPGTTVTTFVLLAVLLTADVLAAKRYLPAHAAGLYAAVSLAGKVVYFATSALSLFLFPVFSERRERKLDGRRALGAALALILLCSAGLSALYFAFPGLVIRPLFGARYAAAAPYLGWIALAFGAYALANLAGTFLLAQQSRVGAVTLGVATVAQLAALYTHHGSIGQIVAVQVVVLGAAAAALMAAAFLTRLPSPAPEVA